MSLQATSLAAMSLQQLTLLSCIGLQEGLFTTEVIGDFPEPEARTYFQGLMSSKGKVSEKVWASVFKVCDNQHALLTSR